MFPFNYLDHPTVTVVVKRGGNTEIGSQTFFIKDLYKCKTKEELCDKMFNNHFPGSPLRASFSDHHGMFFEKVQSSDTNSYEIIFTSTQNGFVPRFLGQDMKREINVVKMEGTATNPSFAMQVKMWLGYNASGGYFPKATSFATPKEHKLKDLIMATPNSNSDSIKFTWRKTLANVHGFACKFINGPFYKNARVSVGNTMALVSEGELGGGRPMRGLIPLGPTCNLLMKKDIQAATTSNRGIRMSVGWKKEIPMESWESDFESVTGYDLVTFIDTSLPSPASFKTPQVLINSFYGALKKHILAAGDTALDAKDVVEITFDQAIKKFIFSCGKQADYIHLTLSQRTAQLFGFDEKVEMQLIGNRRYEGDPLWIEVLRGDVVYIADPRTSDPDSYLSRKLTKIFREGIPYIQPCDQCPSSFLSKYPVQLSLGVDNVYVETDLIDEVMWVGNKKRNCMAVVPIKHEEKGYNLYTPPDAEYIPINKNKRKIKDINISLNDFDGKRIKFASNDTSTVIAHLHLKRVG